MSTLTPTSCPPAAPPIQGMSVFERYLTVWVFLCIVVGIGAGAVVARRVPGHRAHGSRPGQPARGCADLGDGDPHADEGGLAALGEVRQHMRGIGVTLVVNWLVKPFSMAFLGWLFIRQWFAPWLPADQIDSYIAGLILLAAAPCTAMVFVWSRLTGGDPLFTLSQVALNDSIMVLAFAPLVAFLLGVCGHYRAVGHPAHLGGAVHRDPRGHCPAVAARACWHAAQAAFDAALARVGPWSIARAARHPGAAVRLPGPSHPQPAAGHRLAGRADPHPGVLQCRRWPTGSTARWARSAAWPAPRR